MSVLRWMMAVLLPIVFISSTSHAYVFLAPQRPRLVPSDGQTQLFYLTSQAPVFEDKQSFEEGYYADYSDDETFALLVQRAMNYWNEIPSISIQLKVAEERKGVIDSEDNLFSVGVAKITTVASGLAYPAADENNLSRLRDCDIQVGTDIDSIPSFLFVMIHEFGHCLGLGHNHSDPSAIMGYWQPRNEVALGLDDIAGVLSLYPPKAGEKTNAFAPCGSVSWLNSDGPRFFKQKKNDVPRRRLEWMALFMIVCAPMGCLVFQAITSWSFRHRLRRFGR